MNKDPISSNVFRRIAQRTGGKAYWAKTWQKQVEAFEDIREDLGNSYTVTYYPQANPNEGFRKITIEPDQRSGQEVAHPQPPRLSPQPHAVVLAHRGTASGRVPSGPSPFMGAFFACFLARTRPVARALRIRGKAPTGPRPLWYTLPS